MKGLLVCELGNPLPDDIHKGAIVEVNGYTYEVSWISEDRKTVRLSGERVVMGVLETNGNAA